MINVNCHCYKGRLKFEWVLGDYECILYSRRLFFIGKCTRTLGLLFEITKCSEITFLCTLQDDSIKCTKYIPSV